MTCGDQSLSDVLHSFHGNIAPGLGFAQSPRTHYKCARVRLRLDVKALTGGGEGVRLSSQTVIAVFCSLLRRKLHFFSAGADVPFAPLPTQCRGRCRRFTFFVRLFPDVSRADCFRAATPAGSLDVESLICGVR